jgi:hypothetical protein
MIPASAKFNQTGLTFLNLVDGKHPYERTVLMYQVSQYSVIE